MKYYIVCFADNIDYDLSISKLVSTYAEAQKIMRKERKRLLSELERNRIESNKAGKDSFQILCVNGDVFYAQIKEIEVA